MVWYAMLCYAVLYYATLRYAIAMLCYAMLRFAMQVGSYALMHDTGFELVDMLLCCKSAIA